MTIVAGLPALDRFVGWVRDAALPVWAERGFDAAAGSFHERLDLAGRPIAVPHRVMVQARQIYVYAHAGEVGWFPDGTELAMRAMATLRRQFCVDDDAGTSACFSIDCATRRPHSLVRDAYAHAFLLFATAYLYRATGDRTLLAFADSVLRFVDLALVDDVHGGLRTAVDGDAAEKLQNPQMHLLEAYLALAEAAPGRGYLDRADRLVRLLDARMFRWEDGVLPERFGADWGDHPDADVARVFEPGHHFEWYWLLRWYEDLGGIDMGRCRTLLLDKAIGSGCAAGGLIHDQVDASGRVVRAAHRLWPHCEAIKAAAAGDDGLRDAAAARRGETAADALFTAFLDRPFTGGWIDQIAADRAPLVDYVPASSLYHLFLAAFVADTARRGADATRDRDVAA